MGDIAGGLANLLQMVQVLVNAAVDMQDGLVPTGQKLLGVALTLTVLNDVYQWWIKGDATELLAKGVRLFVITSIPASLLLSEGAWVSANQALVGFFQHGVTQALGAASGADLGDVIKGTMKSIVDAVNVAQPASTTTFSWLNPGSWFAAAAETFSSLGGLFIELVLKVIVFIGVAAMMLGMLVAGYVPLVSLQIGVIVGPILIAWLPFEPMANYAHTWLKFMIVNAMTIVVATILLLMTQAAVGSITSILSSMLADGAMSGGLGAFASTFTVLAVLLFVAYMLFQADDIAGGLIGHSSVGGGFMGRAISGAIGRAAKGAAVGGKGGNGGALGMAGRGAQTAVSAGGMALTSAGNQMGQKAAGMLNNGGGSLGNRAGGSVLAGAAAVSYGAGHLANKAAPALGTTVGDAVSKAGGAASRATHAAAGGVGKVAGGTANAAVGGSQKLIDKI